MSLPKPVVVIMALLLVLLVGVASYLSGWKFHVTALYLIPIVWASWIAGRRIGYGLAVVAVVVGLLAELMSGLVYPHPAIPYWNALMLLPFFILVVGLLAAFQTAHYHLEETVQQRTTALQTEIAKRKRLEQAKLQAERLAAVGTMAAQVAHEVRNPLGSITLNLDLIQTEIEHLAATSRHPPAEGRELVNEMRAEVHRIQHVIDDYLQFARLPKVQRRPLAINELLDQKLAFMDREFAAANVKLQTKFAAPLPTINADAEQLWQVVLNLISNSLAAMPAGGILTISTHWLADQLLVRVTDNGAGMSAEQTQQVFVPFYSTKKSGTGLGLALAQQIVSEHGGHIECESAPGRGSTFSIYLPVKEDS